MLNKEKVFIISSNVDDSIRSVSIYTDIFLFKTFKEFEDYIDITPIDASMIIVNSKDLQFTNSSMNRLVAVMNSTFVSIDRFIYYMVNDAEVKEKVDYLCKRNNYPKIKCVYSETLYAKDVADILTGEALSSKETVTEIRTYRIRASEYVKSQKDKEGINYDDIYQTDEDMLSGIEDEPIPEDLRVSEVSTIERHTICGSNDRTTYSWAILKAQYLSMNGKVLLVEKDIEYHTLLDMLTKIDIDFEFYDIVDIFRDCLDVISRIKNSKSKIIFVGSKHKVSFNYEIILNILKDNLAEYIDDYIYISPIKMIPYGIKVDVVIPPTVPEVLKAVNNMSSISNFDDINFIGLDISNLGSICITELEFNSLLQEIFEYDKIHSFVAKVNGLIVRKEVGLGGILMYNSSDIRR